MKLNDKKFGKIIAEPAKISRTPNRTEILVASYYQTYMLTFRVHTFGSINLIRYFIVSFSQSVVLKQLFSLSKFMLPYFPFVVKYFNRGNSGVMPDYFYHDINKIEVTLMSF